MTARAFTLAELLAVIVVMAAAAALLTGASGPLTGSRRVHAVWAVRDALERARLLAERAPEPAWGQPVATLALGQTLVARAAGSALPPQRTALPPGWTASLANEGSAGSEEIRFWTGGFGAPGQSDDAVIALAGPRDATARLELLGISGQVVELREERP